MSSVTIGENNATTSGIITDASAQTAADATVIRTTLINGLTSLSDSSNDLVQLLADRKTSTNAQTALINEALANLVAGVQNVDAVLLSTDASNSIELLNLHATLSNRISESHATRMEQINSIYSEPVRVDGRDLSEVTKNYSDQYDDMLGSLTKDDWSDDTKFKVKAGLSGAIGALFGGAI